MKIGLALSGGGVLGAAHIGLLEELEKQKIPVSIISGASSGAIIGALYSDGGMAKVNSFVDDLKNQGLFDKRRLILNLNPDRLFMQIRETLGRNLSSKDFDDLALKFSCIATDITDGSSLVFDHGNLVDSIMASAAYPGIFPIQKIEGRFYIDGGITHNLPAKATIKMGADFVIGSSLYSLSKFEKVDRSGVLKINRVETTIRALDILQHELASNLATYCDFCFDPPVGEHHWFNIDRFDEILEIGRVHARANIGELIGKIAGKKVKRGFWHRLTGK